MGDWTCEHESTGHNDGECCAVCALGEQVATLTRERDEALAHVETLREALNELGPIVRGLGEHGVGIVMESEAADGSRWTGDPAFVTKLKEVIRIWGNGAADIVEKRVAIALASTPAQSLAAVEARVAERCAEIAEKAELGADHKVRVSGSSLQESLMLAIQQSGLLLREATAAAIRREFGIGGTK